MGVAPSTMRGFWVSGNGRSRAGGLAGKVLSVPLAFVLAASCASSHAYALASGGEGDLTVSPAAAEGSGLSAAGEGHVNLYSCYLPVLFRAANGLGEFSECFQASDPSQWAPEYFLFDLGSDGVPELMVRTSAFSGAGLVHVFAPKGGSAVQLGSYWEWFGGSAGNDVGDLFIAGWHQGNSYVNSVSLEGEKVVSNFLKSGKATASTPNGEIKVVNDFLMSRRASWIDASEIHDYSLLESKARYSIEKGTVTIAPAGAYTGEAKTPQVTVKFGGETLRQGVDFAVSFQDNVNAGTGTVTVVGLGDYAGTTSACFSIAKADLSKAEVSIASAGAYTGAAKTPEATVKLNSLALKASRDFSVSYRDNVNAGNGTATVTGKGNYQGTKSVSFAISRADVSRAAVTVASAGSYTGQLKTPAVKAVVGGRSLVQDVDCKITYKNNRNAGKATAVVEGRGNYSGSRAVPFTIEKADISKSTVSISLAGSYTGDAKTPSASVKYLGANLRAVSDYSISYRDNVNAGTAIAVISGRGNYRGKKSVGFSIGKADISKASISLASAGTFTGMAKTPAAKVLLGGAALRSKTDFTVSYKDNVNAGTATAIVAGKGNYRGSKKAEFAIAKAANPLALSVARKTVLQSRLAKSACTVSALSFEGKPQGKVTFKNESEPIVSKVASVNKSTGVITFKKGTKKGTYSVRVRVTAAGNGNYSPSSKVVTAKVDVR